MAFAKTFDPSKPLGSDLVSDIDTIVGANNAAIVERLALEHYNLTTSAPNAGSATDTEATAQGRHIPGKCGVVYIGTTSQITALGATIAGCLAYDTTLGRLVIYGSGGWVTYGVGAGYRFAAARASAVLGGSGTVQVTGLVESLDLGANFASDAFTVPVTGDYIFNYMVRTVGATGQLDAMLYKTGVVISGTGASSYSPSSSNTTDVNGCSGILSLTAGDVITLWWRYESTHNRYVSASFSGYKI